MVMQCLRQDDIDRFNRLLDGDPDTDAKGLRERVKNLETLSQEIRDLRLQLKGALTTIRWLSVFLGLSGLSSIISIITQLT